jgi:hypothetical protein
VHDETDSAFRKGLLLVRMRAPCYFAKDGSDGESVVALVDDCSGDLRLGYW